METERSEVFLVDSYKKKLKSEVIDVNDNGVVLDKTIFYPRGGGQPADKGVLVAGDDKIEVEGIKRKGKKIILQINGNLEKGDTVTQKIDWDYRYKLMRHHTALHILSAVVWDKFEAKVTGGTIYHNKARLDFDLDEFSTELAEKLVKEVNRIIEEDHEVTISFTSREEAEQDPELIRTKVNLLPDFIQEIRLVKIGDVDIQADGGLHVKRTSEIGKIKLLDTENKGKGRKRISIAIADT